MGEELAPAGLGTKLYICPAEDFKKDPSAPMQEVKPVLEGFHIDLSEAPKREDSDEKPGKGWSVTCTGTLSCEPSPETQRMWRRLLLGEGRLPRKEKKRRMNRVLRDRKVVMLVASMIATNSSRVTDALTTVMFPDKLRRTTDDSLVVMPNPAQTRAAWLCSKRIPKQAARIWRKHRTELLREMAELEQKVNNR